MLICFLLPMMIQTTITLSRTYFCRFCLEEHAKNCFTFAAQRTEFPDEPVAKFENIQKQVKAPFTVYADFKSI